MSGANRLGRFLDIELPLIRPGIVGAATFSLILSFNETIRTSVVQGRYNTVQTYIWSTYKQIGLSPALYALMSLLIVLTLGLGRRPSWSPARAATPEAGLVLERDDRVRREADGDRASRRYRDMARRGRHQLLAVGQPTAHSRAPCRDRCSRPALPASRSGCSSASAADVQVLRRGWRYAGRCRPRHRAARRRSATPASR